MEIASRVPVYSAAESDDCDVTVATNVMQYRLRPRHRLASVLPIFGRRGSYQTHADTVPSISDSRQQSRAW